MHSKEDNIPAKLSAWQTKMNTPAIFPEAFSCKYSDYRTHPPSSIRSTTSLKRSASFIMFKSRFVFPSDQKCGLLFWAALHNVWLGNSDSSEQNKQEARRHELW